MKKRLTLVLVLMLTFSMPVMAAPKEKDNNGKKPVAEPTVVSEPLDQTAIADQPTDVANSDADLSNADQEEDIDEISDAVNDQVTDKKDNPKKDFKKELNEQKKELTQEKSDLAEEKEALESEYEALLASGDTEGAQALLSEIETINQSLDTLKNQIKTIINERHMVVKTMYTDEELAQFESVNDLIEQMYEDAKTLDAGSLTINNQLIKFKAPIYIKGGNVMVPVKAITEKLGAEILFDEETQTLSLSKEDTVITITTTGVEVTIDGELVDITDQIEVTCGRSYINLSFLAEIFDLEASYDEENELIDLEEPADETADAPSDSATEEIIDTPTDETSDIPSDDSADESVDTTVEEPTDATTDTPADEPADTSSAEDPVTPNLGETL
ncbi:stalk domain-containing protein [Eubacteriaceae bacterium ES2]|nr:stalk domain-containing protein [Eubacteriaceae bacterium ES2]